MARQPATKTRPALSRDRVLSAAIELADESGVEALTMRALASRLDVEAMSLYYHVANKEALLDGIAESVVEEVNTEVEHIGPPATPDDWQRVMSERLRGARRVMLRHPWAPGVLETRTSMNPAVLAYFDGVVEIFRSSGFSYDLIHHAMHALGSRALGFAQEMFNPSSGSNEEASNSETLAAFASRIPFLVEMIGEISHEDPDSTIGWCDDQSEFEFSIDLMLGGLERLRLAESA